MAKNRTVKSRKGGLRSDVHPTPAKTRKLLKKASKGRRTKLKQKR